MKAQKLILPLLIIAIAAILYFLYFSPKDELGFFSDFDTNNNANRDIVVKLLHENGFVQDKNSGGTVFYVEDATGKVVRVVGPLTLPPGMDVISRVTLRGHLHTDYFHAASVTPRN
jgi:predicted RNA binding protein YcfA (HicA-like mRNA interferase family)